MMQVQERSGVREAATRLPTWADRVPPEIAAVITEFRSAEVSTLAKDGTPIAWPMAVLYQPERGRFVTTTSIGLPQKAYNVRRDGRVSILYSNATGSGLINPPAVLVQGDATAPDEVVIWNDDLRQLWSILAVRQPSSNVYATTRLGHALMDWYYMRLLMLVVPRRICWWPEGDFSRAPREIEVGHVG
jgi:hypothetical protein